MRRQQKSDKVWGMGQVLAVALALLLTLFFMPFLFLEGGGKLRPEPTEPPEPTATLPIDHTPVSPPPAAGGADSATQVRVKLPDGSVKAMTMGAYLVRVVAAEMPASFAVEALKAQTVAVRTYTVTKMERTVEQHPDAHMCTDINCCQAYIEPEAAAANWGERAGEYSGKIAAAVAETDGLIATYEGTPIQAVFFSSAAGRTVDAVEVWGNAVPYLKGVESPEGEEVPNYHSTMSLTPEGFRAIFLSQHADANLDGDSAGWFDGVERNSAGGVESMKIGGVRVEGMELRTLFGLRSTHFDLRAEGGSITFRVTGYGHGVGLSQYGANALAAQGKTCEEIIKWYYTGVALEKMN